MIFQSDTNCRLSLYGTLVNLQTLKARILCWKIEIVTLCNWFSPHIIACRIFRGSLAPARFIVADLN